MVGNLSAKSAGRFMNPKQLSQELCEGKNPHMSHPRAIIGLSCLVVQWDN